MQLTRTHRSFLLGSRHKAGSERETDYEVSMATIKKSKKGATAPVLPEKATKMAKATEVKASKYRGLKTGMRVQEFQDQSFADNFKAMLTDEELAQLWRVEFPQAVAFTPHHVMGARRDYNKGTHSKAFADRKPATPLQEVVIAEGGKRRWASEVKAETKAETKAAPKTDAAPAAGKKARKTSKAA